MQVQGRVIQVMNTEENNGFKKRSLILATEETSQYPQELNIEFTQGKCDDLNNIMPNQQVNVDINLRGRRWTNPQGETKFFNTIQGWRIQVAGQQQQQGGYQGQGSAVNDFKQQQAQQYNNGGQQFQQPQQQFNQQGYQQPQQNYQQQTQYQGQQNANFNQQMQQQAFNNQGQAQMGNDDLPF